MSFTDQPSELFIEQALSLPVEDLLSFCQTNPRLVEICQDPRIWRARIAAEFPGVDITKIADPREFYLSSVLYGGEIYVNGEVLAYKPIRNENLFQYTRDLAEVTGEPYTIVYSSP